MAVVHKTGTCLYSCTGQVETSTSFWFVPLVLVTDIGLVACSGMLLRDYSRENARKIKKLVLLFFVIGLLAYVVGVI